MSNRPLVTVVLPTYNRGYVIREAVDSVVAQTYSNWELKIVDDGSTDDTVALLKKSYGEEARISYSVLGHQGATVARNTGAELAGGELLTFLDSDDVADPSWLEKMVAEIVDGNAQLVSCGVTKIDADGGTQILLPMAKSTVYHGYRAKLTNGGSYLLSTQLFKTIGAFDPKIRSGQHTELGFRLTRYMKENQLTASTVEEPLITVIDRGGASIRADTMATFEGVQHFIAKHENYMIRKKRDLLFNLLSIAGQRGVKLGRVQAGRAYLKRAWLLRPYSLKASYRLARATFLSIGKG